MSSLNTATVSDFVHSSLSFFASRRGGELPGTWFVEALGALGIEEQAIRQTLFRLERTGVLLSRREGRAKWYRASPATEGVMAAGRNRVAVAETKWDQKWTLVHFRVGEDRRDSRDRIRDLLLVEGFASLAPGLYLHPRERTDHILTAAKALGLEEFLHIFRGPQVAGRDPERLVHELWDLAAVAARYRKFIKRYARIAQRAPDTWSPKESFAIRFAFMFDYFRITWDDPALPVELLPVEWPAEEARKVADSLMKGLMDAAVEFGDQVLREVAGVPL